MFAIWSVDVGDAPLRIVHVSDCYLPRLGGIERQVHDLAVRQRQRGHEVQIVTCVADGQTGGIDEPTGSATPFAAR